VWPACRPQAGPHPILPPPHPRLSSGKRNPSTLAQQLWKPFHPYTMITAASVQLGVFRKRRRELPTPWMLMKLLPLHSSDQTDVRPAHSPRPSHTPIRPPQNILLSVSSSLCHTTDPSRRPLSHPPLLHSCRNSPPHDHSIALTNWHRCDLPFFWEPLLKPASPLPRHPHGAYGHYPRWHWHSLLLQHRSIRGICCRSFPVVPLRCPSQRRVRQGPFPLKTWQGGEIEPYALQGRHSRVCASSVYS